MNSVTLEQRARRSTVGHPPQRVEMPKRFNLNDLCSTLRRIATQFALAVSKLRIANSHDEGIGAFVTCGFIPQRALWQNDLDRRATFSDPEWQRKWNTPERLISLELFLDSRHADCVFRHRNDGHVRAFSEDEPLIASRLEWLPVE